MPVLAEEVNLFALGQKNTGMTQKNFAQAAGASFLCSQNQEIRKPQIHRVGLSCGCDREA